MLMMKLKSKGRAVPGAAVSALTPAGGSFKGLFVQGLHSIPASVIQHEGNEVSKGSATLQTNQEQTGG